MNQTVRSIAKLKSEMSGKCSAPGDPQYEAAISIWAKSYIRPRLIVHCTDTKDVQNAIRLARETEAPLSVRAGGHDWAGRALCEGIVVNLTNMRGVALDRTGNTARIGGGARGIDLFGLTDPIGMAAATGSVGLVGLAGLTLGGGYGPLSGRFGLACDNLVGADVVLADGTTVRAGADGDRELLWALRGGGGNFGVVTALDIQLHELPSVRAGVMIFPLEEAFPVLVGTAEICQEAPDELNVQVGIVPGPGGASFAVVSPTWSGPTSRGEAQVAPLARLGSPLMERVHDRPYGDSRSIFDDFVVNGRPTFVETAWLPCLTNDAARIFVEQIHRRPSPLCSIMTHEFRGAAARVAPEATAFGFRRRHIMVEIIAQVDLGAYSDGTAERHWVGETLRLLQGLALPGRYANMADDHDPARVRSSFGPNGDRLMAAKKRYDPDNLFASAVALPSTEWRFEPVTM